jgi:hypothetical protein
VFRASPRTHGAAVLVTLALTLGMGAPASANDVRVHHALFGTHDSSPGTLSLTRIDEGSVRLWEVGVQWDQIETTKNYYDWTRLDQLVSAAQAAHADVTMTVAMTPSFYADSPTDPPRNLDAYRRFVRALMERYRRFDGSRGISSYQVWNEVNISTYWTGTTHQLAELTRIMARERDILDPEAKVIAPAMVTRLKFELDGISTYYGYRLHGVPVWKYLDAVSVSLYPLPTYGRRAGIPEDSMRLLAQVRQQLRRAGVPASMPIWNTEVNYGLPTGAPVGTAATPISAGRQAANVVRTYLLNAANGVRRVFWYRYNTTTFSFPDGGAFADTLLSVPDHPDELTAAGEAYLRVQRWMHGTLLGSKGHRPCARDAHGTYTCVVRDSTGTRRIYWNPFHHARVRLARHARELESVLGAIRTVVPRSRLRVGPEPVMVGRTGPSDPDRVPHRLGLEDVGHPA